jgi:multidrug resistance efflux pump
MRRLILIPLLIVVVVLAIVGGVGYWLWNSYYYYNTDDAQVNSQIVNIASTASGQLNTLDVKMGDKVTAGEVIGTVTTVSQTTGKPATVNVTSPIDGTIVQLNVAQGQVVTPGLAIASVTNLNSVNVIAYVDESAINNIKLNQDVDVKIDAYSNTSYTGHVQQIVQAAAGEFSLLPTTDNASGNFTKVSQRIPVIISLDGNGGNNLMPGMSAEVTIHIR